MLHGHDAERATTDGQRHAELHLDRLVGGPRQHAARPRLGGGAGGGDANAGGIRELHDEALGAERLHQRGEQAFEQRGDAQLGRDVLDDAMKILELDRTAHEVLVEPLELLDLVDETVDQALVELAQIGGRFLLLDPFPLAPQEVGDLPRERVGVDRLGDVSVAPGHQRALAIALHRVGGDGHDRHLLEARKRLEDHPDFVAVHAGQVHVEQDQRGLLAKRRLDAGEAFLGVDQRVAFRLEERPHEHAVLGVVLDVEDLDTVPLAAADRHQRTNLSGPGPARTAA